MRFAVVLGGALNSNGELTQYVKNRCLTAVYEREKYDYYFVSSRYSLNVPPKLDENGYIIYENKKISDYLQVLGIPRNQIILESSSTDTIGSAIFCRIYMENLLMGFKKSLEIVLITSKFHMPRSYEIFSWAFSLKPHIFQLKIRFLTANDSCITKEREKHELISLKNFKNEWYDINSFQIAFSKLLSAHDNYSNMQASNKRNICNLNY
ncbi:YdcF family protein [Alphaproteobacteria bacterium]|nr:YdcF family protein [Alphaproteobacteria bacterium]